MLRKLAARDAELAAARATIEVLHTDSCAYIRMRVIERAELQAEIATLRDLLDATPSHQWLERVGLESRLKSAEAEFARLGLYTEPAAQNADAPDDHKALGAKWMNEAIVGDLRAAWDDREYWDKTASRIAASVRSPAAQGKTSAAEEALAAAFEPGCEAGCAHGHWTIDPVAWLTSRDRATAERVRREVIEELRAPSGDHPDSPLRQAADWLAARGKETK